VGGDVGSKCLVIAAVRRVYNRERLITGRSREGGLEGLRGVWWGKGSCLEGMAVGWRSVGDANCAVESSDVCLLSDEGDCDFAGRALWSEGWNGDSMNRRSTAKSRVSPFWKCDDFLRVEVFPSSY